MAEVHLWGALRPAAGGAPLVHVEAKTIRELFRKLEEQYPGMAPHIARGVAVSIAGKIYRDNWQTELPEGAHIYLLPRIQAGNTTLPIPSCQRRLASRFGPTPMKLDPSLRWG